MKLTNIINEIKGLDKKTVFHKVYQNVPISSMEELFDIINNKRDIGGYTSYGEYMDEEGYVGGASDELKRYIDYFVRAFKQNEILWFSFSTGGNVMNTKTITNSYRYLDAGSSDGEDDSCWIMLSNEKYFE
jgi:hypothetical protein